MLTDKNRSDRIFGLDILRSTAILIVVVSHSSNIVEQTFPNFPFIPTPDGVNLFFVLSGFLIGRILIQKFDNNQPLNFSTVLQFLKRRWFRTLPNYFLFLLLNIFLVYKGYVYGQINTSTFNYFIFCQYLYKPYDFFFWESWSLCVEEWFYVLFPLCLLCLSFLAKQKISFKRIVFISIALFIVLPLIYRMVCLSFHPYTYLDYHRLVIFRLDNIGFGLAGAYVFTYYPKVWNNFKPWLFVIGFCLMIYLFRFTSDTAPLLHRIIYLSVSGFSILLLLPWLSNINTETIPLKPFRFLSKISYSMYLINIPLVLVTETYWKNSKQEYEVYNYLLFWIILVILSYLVYNFFEKPMMDLRDRPKTANKPTSHDN